MPIVFMSVCVCVGLQSMLVLFTNTPYSGRHGEGPSRASILSKERGGGAGSATGAMKVIEIL